MGLTEDCEFYFGSSNFYNVLSLNKTATKSQIKEAYRKASLFVHPDRAAPEKQAEALKKFKVLAHVHIILSDGEKKAIYDETGVVEDENCVSDEEKSPEFWKQYWRTIFPKITLADIETFFEKYKGSEEELKDLQNCYIKCEGDMNLINKVFISFHADEEDRIKNLLTDMISKEEIPAFPKFTQEFHIKVKGPILPRQNAVVQSAKSQLLSFENTTPTVCTASNSSPFIIHLENIKNKAENKSGENQPLRPDVESKKIVQSTFFDRTQERIPRHGFVGPNGSHSSFGQHLTGPAMASNSGVSESAFTKELNRVLKSSSNPLLRTSSWMSLNFPFRVKGPILPRQNAVVQSAMGPILPRHNSVVESEGGSKTSLPHLVQSKKCGTRPKKIPPSKNPKVKATRKKKVNKSEIETWTEDSYFENMKASSRLLKERNQELEVKVLNIAAELKMKESRINSMEERAAHSHKMNQGIREQLSRVEKVEAILVHDKSILKEEEKIILNCLYQEFSVEQPIYIGEDLNALLRRYDEEEAQIIKIVNNSIIIIRSHSMKEKQNLIEEFQENSCLFLAYKKNGVKKILWWCPSNANFPERLLYAKAKMIISKLCTWDYHLVTDKNIIDNLF